MPILLGEFTARDDKGNEYKIQIRRSVTPGGTMMGSRGQLQSGMIYLRTKDGVAVIRVEKGRDELLTTDGSIEVTSDDPNAP